MGFLDEFKKAFRQSAEDLYRPSRVHGFEVLRQRCYEENYELSAVEMEKVYRKAFWEHFDKRKG